MNPLIEKIIPEQKKTSTRVGGMLIIFGETMFLFSILNFLMISRLQYYSSGDSFIRTIFPHYIFFLAGLSVVGFVAMWFTYVYILPSKQKFSQQQAVKDSRSPMYNRIVDMHDEMADMRRTIEEMSKKLDELSGQNPRN